MYVCGEVMVIRLLPDGSFTEEGSGKSCRGGGGSRGKGADVRGVNGRTGDGSLGETPSGVDDKNEADVEETAELESDVLR